MSTLAQRQPNVTAEQISGRDYVSFSAINTFRQCPLRYFFKYVERLPEETVSASLVLGGAVHSAAEFHFNELMAGNPAPDLDTLLSVFWDSWHGRGEEAAIQFGKTEDINSIARTADRILRQFQQSELANPAGRIIGVEEQIRGELVPRVPDVLARIDLIVESDEAVTITDLKTARSRWSASQAEDAGEQLLIYGELARQLVPHKKLRLQFAVITKAVTPVTEQWAVNIDPQRIQRTRRMIQRVWQAIQSGNFYPAPSPIACASCPFRKPCRHWKG